MFLPIKSREAILKFKSLRKLAKLLRNFQRNISASLVTWNVTGLEDKLKLLYPIRGQSHHLSF
jgi:hypothetical protein